MKTRIIPVIFTAAITSLATLFVVAKFNNPKPYFTAVEHSSNNGIANYTAYEGGIARTTPGVDFQNAAEASVKAVVHIKTQTKARTMPADDYFGRLFGQQYYIPSQVGSGSGVVISPDGYIVTNNHVIANADQVTVTFNDRYTTEAKVLSKDPSTDIAVLKVNEKNLPFMQFGNSDNVKLGQWVLAVGYPLTLDATVTAGIVSAKGRSIGINKTQSRNAIESFIQTDAAVNPGNSGGALVNTDGELVGINSAIASPTGSYAGYSYAIPANLVRKVVNDMVQFGAVQRGYLGVQLIDRKTATPEEISALGIDKTEGVYVRNVITGSGADKADIKRGDFIVQVNNITVNTEPELLEQIAHYRPGDNLNITYLRNGSRKTTRVQLQNIDGNTAIVKEQSGSNHMLGAKYRPLSNEEKNKYDITGGVVVSDIGTGALAQAKVKKDFIIIAVNETPINNTDDLKKALDGTSNVQIAGFYPGYKGVYYYTINIE